MVEPHSANHVFSPLSYRKAASHVPAMFKYVSLFSIKRGFQRHVEIRAHSLACKSDASRGPVGVNAGYENEKGHPKVAQSIGSSRNYTMLAAPIAAVRSSNIMTASLARIVSSAASVTRSAPFAVVSLNAAANPVRFTTTRPQKKPPPCEQGLCKTCFNTMGNGGREIKLLLRQDKVSGI